MPFTQIFLHSLLRRPQNITNSPNIKIYSQPPDVFTFLSLYLHYSYASSKVAIAINIP